MNGDYITIIIKSVITIATVMVTGFVIPWLKSRIDAGNLEKIEAYCEFAVRCAEQLFTVEEFSRKKSYVLDYVNKKVEEFGINMTIEDINNLIEATVNEVKRG